MLTKSFRDPPNSLHLSSLRPQEGQLVIHKTIMTPARMTYSTVAMGTALWCAAILVAPILVASSGPYARIGQFIYHFFRPICHQLAHRSFHFMGEPLAVCSRCTSIYVAFLVGTLFYPLVKVLDRPQFPPSWMLIAVTLPMVLDVFAELIGLHNATIVTRVLTGSTFGLIAPYVVLPAAIEAFQQLTSPFASSPDIHPQKGVHDVTSTR
jgi:uncharacterized membrane protein